MLYIAALVGCGRYCVYELIIAACLQHFCLSFVPLLFAVEEPVDSACRIISLESGIHKDLLYTVCGICRACRFLWTNHRGLQILNISERQQEVIVDGCQQKSFEGSLFSHHINVRSSFSICSMLTHISYLWLIVSPKLRIHCHLSTAEVYELQNIDNNCTNSLHMLAICQLSH